MIYFIIEFIEGTSWNEKRTETLISCLIWFLLREMWSKCTFNLIESTQKNLWLKNHFDIFATLNMSLAEYQFHILSHFSFTFPSLLRKASWIFQTSSGPAHAVSFPISKNCVIGLLSMGLILVWFVALLNIENMIVGGEEEHLLLEHTKESSLSP